MSLRVLPFLGAAVSLLSVGALTSTYGQTTATTDPVGMVQVTLPADTDTYVYLPFKRSPEYAGTAAAAPSKNGTYDFDEPFSDSNGNGVHDSGETFTDTANIVTLSGTPGLTANQYVYVAGTQPKHYYLLLTDGAKAGMFYTILSNTATTVTLDLAGDNIASAVASGTHVQIVPYDTLGTIFPTGTGVVGSTSYSFFTRKTEILIPNQAGVGINPGYSGSYFYYSGAAGPGAGWRSSGALDSLADDTILYPDSFFIVRNAAGSATSLTFTGTVNMSSLQAPLNVFAANTAQDNPVALQVATALTLAQTKLYDPTSQPGPFAGSTSMLDDAGRGDVLMVWDNTVTGHNRQPTRSYFYYTGTDSPGWKLINGDNSASHDSTAADSVFGTAGVVVVRKKATATTGTTFWTVKPPYVP